MILFASGFTCPLGPKIVKKIGNFRIFFAIIGCIYACIPLVSSYIKNYIVFIILYGMGFTFFFLCFFLNANFINTLTCRSRTRNGFILCSAYNVMLNALSKTSSLNFWINLRIYRVLNYKYEKM